MQRHHGVTLRVTVQAVVHLLAGPQGRPHATSASGVRQLQEPKPYSQGAEAVAVWQDDRRRRHESQLWRPPHQRMVFYPAAKRTWVREAAASPLAV